MASFALVTEGITDQLVLKHLIHGIVEDKDDEDVRFSILQPLLDATDEARQARGSYGGWEKVLEYCTKTTELLNALSVNQYLVIQIDTDCCEHVNFGLSLQTPIAQLALDTKAVLIEKLTQEFYDKYKDRIIFAISIHSTECWLLPYYGSSVSSRKKVTSCEQKLNNELNKQKIDYNKDGDCYMIICKPLSKYKNIRSIRAHNNTLNDFVASVEALAPYAHKIGT